MAEKTERFEQWCIVELMGHQRMAGLVTEVTLAGGAFLRVDVPEGGGQAGYTRLLNPSAIYALNPTSEALARQAAAVWRPKPVNEWELPRALPPATAPVERSGECVACGLDAGGHVSADTNRPRCKACGGVTVVPDPDLADDYRLDDEENDR